MSIINSGVGITSLDINTTPSSAKVVFYGTDGTQSTGVGKASYSASTPAFTSPATPTDVAILTGSDYKTIHVVGIGITSVQTTAGVNAWFIIKRSTANSSGGINIVSIARKDFSFPGSLAKCQYYTSSNPTPGATVGNIWTGWISSQITTTAGIEKEKTKGVMVNFLDLYGQPITLRGSSESVAVNFNGAALPAGLTQSIVFQWTEE